MMHNLHPYISLILLVGVAAAMGWIAAETARRYAARGTRPRYVWAGVERMFRWPAGIYLGMSAITWLAYDQYLYFLMDTIGVALWLWVLYEKRRDGDDEDFWTAAAQKMRDILSPGATTTASP